ncbi:NADH dehydrogenase [Thermosipho affectus]|uniref:NADH dehydrogenase n=1 Tax=Thermosipho affectus TaxID=660294 RepID=A0ABX3IHE3_9BACT|nr:MULTISPECIES: NADH-quinone oxidoreductase subunit B [Thermosipho]ANQ54142.1 NADH dehydrogenase subunit B [Thermosipho sp. 1070]APT72587.1 NADH dehydrogenase [Thermosipho sp. 1063]ONN26591.1 NADH dehydrogenase [Thermosipho affectus]OOC41986.1 NADH dehydrogenase [Thermosipho sp. 1074]
MAVDERSLWEKIADKLRSRSLWMLHYCTGCGAMELPPTMTSRFDMERFGMGPMATPRQADILFITGYLSAKTLRRVIYTYEKMAEPRYVIGFGSCTLNGGIYYDSYATINRLDYYIPVDLYIAGCMPRPEALLEAFNELMRMIRRGEANGWKKYKENYEWYKQNQIRSLGEVFVHDEFHE